MFGNLVLLLFLLAFIQLVLLIISRQGKSSDMGCEMNNMYPCFVYLLRLPVGADAVKMIDSSRISMDHLVHVYGYIPNWNGYAEFFCMQCTI